MNKMKYLLQAFILFTSPPLSIRAAGLSLPPLPFKRLLLSLPAIDYMYVWITWRVVSVFKSIHFAVFVHNPPGQEVMGLVSVLSRLIVLSGCP